MSKQQSLEDRVAELEHDVREIKSVVENYLEKLVAGGELIEKKLADVEQKAAEKIRELFGAHIAASKTAPVNANQVDGNQVQVMTLTAAPQGAANDTQPAAAPATPSGDNSGPADPAAPAAAEAQPAGQASADHGDGGAGQAPDAAAPQPNPAAEGPAPAAGGVEAGATGAEAPAKE